MTLQYTITEFYIRKIQNLYRQTQATEIYFCRCVNCKLYYIQLMKYAETFADGAKIVKKRYTVAPPGVGHWHYPNSMRFQFPLDVQSDKLLSRRAYGSPVDVMPLDTFR